MRLIAAIAILWLVSNPIDHQLVAQRLDRAGVSTRAPAFERLDPTSAWSRSLLSDTTAAPSTPEGRASAWGAGIGALLGGADGLLMGLGDCDGAGPQRTCVTQIAVGGAVVGAVVGYGVGWMIGHGRH